MKRTTLLFAVTLFFAAVKVGGTAAATESNDTFRPNIIFLLTDDQRDNTLAGDGASLCQDSECGPVAAPVGAISQHVHRRARLCSQPSVLVHRDARAGPRRRIHVFLPIDRSAMGAELSRSVAESGIPHRVHWQVRRRVLHVQRARDREVRFLVGARRMDEVLAQGFQESQLHAVSRREGGRDHLHHGRGDGEVPRQSAGRQTVLPVGQFQRAARVADHQYVSRLPGLATA